MAKLTLNQRDTISTQKEINKIPIKCTQCSKLLGHIVEIEDPNPKTIYKIISMTKYECICPCGNECYPIKSDKHTVIMTENNYALIDMQSKDNVTSIKIGKVK